MEETNVDKFVIYKNILEMIKLQNLTTSQSNLTKDDVYKNKEIIIRAEHNTELNGKRNTERNKQKFIFLYITADDSEFYKSANMLRIYKKIPEIKTSTRSYSLDCITIGNITYSKFTATVFPKITITSDTFYIKHRFVPSYIFCINILEHHLLNYKYKIITTDEDKNKLFNQLGFNIYDDKWENLLPKIFYTDPISIWFGLKIGDVLYYDGYYRECIDDTVNRE